TPARDHRECPARRLPTRRAVPSCHLPCVCLPQQRQRVLQMSADLRLRQSQLRSDFSPRHAVAVTQRQAGLVNGLEIDGLENARFDWILPRLADELFDVTT